MSDPCEQHIRALNREAAKKKVEELIGRLRAKNRPFEQAAAILAHVSNPTTPSEGYFEIDYGFGDLVVDKGLFKAPLLKGAPGQAPRPCARCLCAGSA